jgi:hypothetical protein
MDVLILLLEIDARGDLAPLERHGDFDDAGKTAGRFAMPDVGLH